jgi:glycosyltransferase involved in cell wall biosynthesis
MTGPLVTVITAAYNSEAHLHEALESAFAQDYEPFEVIVVDDGSTDRTAEIAQSFPVRYLWQENTGAAGARNLALAQASGEFVTFLDADDVLPPNKITLQAQHLLDHPAVGCVLGRQEIMFDGIAPPEWLERDPIYGDLEGIPLLSLMARKPVLDELGGFDATYSFAEDRELLIRMRERGIEIAVLDDIVLYRRFHGRNQQFDRPQPPIFRSLKEKLERARTGAE